MPYRGFDNALASEASWHLKSGFDKSYKAEIVLRGFDSDRKVFDKSWMFDKS